MYQNNNYNGGNQPFNPNYNQQYSEYTRRMMYYTNKRRNQKNELIRDSFIIGGSIIAFLVIQVAVTLLLQATPYKELYDRSALFQYSFNIIAVHILALAVPFSLMALILRKRFVGPLIPVKKVEAPVFLSWIGVGMGISLGAGMLTNAIVELIKKGGYELSQPEYNNAKSPIAFAMMFLSIAIVPAVFEEYALRCCTLGALRGRGKAFAVVTVSIVFGLIHGNAIQFIFAFIVGLICGYITIKTDNVIIAMFIHGFNNGLSVVSEILEYSVGKKTANYIIAAIVVFWVASCVAGLLYLINKRELFDIPKKRAYDPGELSFGSKLACMLPGLALPILVLILISTQFIKKIG